MREQLLNFALYLADNFKPFMFGFISGGFSMLCSLAWVGVL